MLLLCAAASVTRAQPVQPEPPMEAQPAQPEQSPDELREAAHWALAGGRFEDALHLFEQASLRTNEARVWLELGDAADRLRRDDVALRAYPTYLDRFPQAPDRTEIEARVQVLRARPRCVEPSQAPVLAPWPSTPSEPEATAAATPRALSPMPAAEVGLGRRLAEP